MTLIMFCTRCLRTTVARRQIVLSRQFSVSTPFRSVEPQVSTPTTAPGEAPKAPAQPRSICVEGTVLTGLNYTKGKQDPVALKDEDYPEWLWSCLDVMKKSSDAGDDGAADEFSKSRKVRREAAKRQRALEAKLLAGGDLEALAPKIPLQHQSVNLPGSENATVAENIEAANKREELRKAMRKERKAKIKESNYLKSMSSDQAYSDGEKILGVAKKEAEVLPLEREGLGQLTAVEVVVRHSETPGQQHGLLLERQAMVQSDGEARGVAAAGGGGGGGGGGAAGAEFEDGGGGGGGGAEGVVATGGGAAAGGGGGGGAGAEGAKDRDDGFRDVGRGGGFFPMGGGGFFPAGLVVSFMEELRKLPMPPGGGIGGPRPGIAGAALGGGFGAEKLGGLGAEWPVSPGSER
ncbi:hypothetical protein HJFPF1_01018 [Paramyrothecium foliicola]|nr:hypothetical protein HJFPF1_01018 [Paramyrothecium foliicola]